MCINFLKMEVWQKYTCNTADIPVKSTHFPSIKISKNYLD